MGKRGNGEGTISRRKNGGWMAQYYVYTPDGRRRKTLYGKTRAAVSEKLTKAMADRDGGLVFDAGKMTVAEYLDRWLSDSARGTVRTSTFYSYERQLKRYVYPPLGRLPLKELTELHVQGLYRSMQDRGSPPAPSAIPTPSSDGRSSRRPAGSTSRATPATTPTRRRSRETRCVPSTRTKPGFC